MSSLMRGRHDLTLSVEFWMCRTNGLVFDCSLRRADAGDGHAEGRAADVVHAELGAELNR